jgi:MFS family permease
MPLLPLACLAFVAIALPDGLLGVAWPAMSTSLGQPVGALAVLVPFAVVSSMLSSASTGFVLPRVGVGRLLAASTALSAVALLGQAAAPAFGYVILTAVLVSAGSGAVDAALNAYAARHFDARRITWMHACYGLGAAAGPVALAGTTWLGVSWRWAFGAIAAAQAVLSVAFGTAARAWVTPPAPRTPSAGRSVPPAVWSGAVLFALQTGFESCTSLWTFVFLTEARGLPSGFAGASVSAYWIALLAGRVVLGPFADRVGTRHVLAAGLAGMVGGALLVLLPGYPAVAGVVVLGLAVAPMFPLLTLTTGERVGPRYADRAVGIQAAASAAGAATLPAAAGILIDRYGAAVLGPCLVALAAITTIGYARAGRRRRQPVE